MKLKSLGLSVAVATLLSLGFTGCGSDSDSDEVVEQVSSTTTTDTTVVEPKEVSLSEALVEDTIWRIKEPQEENLNDNPSRMCYAFKEDSIILSFAVQSTDDAMPGYINITDKDDYKIATYDATSEITDNKMKLYINGEMVQESLFTNIYTNAMDAQAIQESGELTKADQWVLDTDCLNNIRPYEYYEKSED